MAFGLWWIGEDDIDIEGAEYVPKLRNFGVFLAALIDPEDWMFIAVER